MLATRRLATSKLAVISSKEEFAPVDYEGDLCIVNQAVGALYFGDLAVVEQSVILEINYDGDLASIPQTVQLNYDGDLALVSQSVFKQGQTYPFNDSIAFDNFGEFSVRILCDGLEVDLCRYMKEIVITHEESKASLARMTFKQDAGQNVDLHQYLNKNVRIELTRPDKPAYLIYDGLFDASNWNFGNLFIEWSATAPRERLFEKMSKAQIEAIGVFDENVFKKLDDYDDKQEQVNDRLSTIPASLDFINGNPIVTSWFPKFVADYNLDACAILRDGANNSVNSQETVVNTVKVKIQYQWDLLRQADRMYYFDSGYSVCDYSTWGLPPMNSTIQSAAQGTGWVFSHYDSTGLHPYGMYYCSWRGGNPAPMWWNPRGGVFQPHDPNDPESRDFRTVTDYTNVYAQTASFGLSKRWAQPIEEMIEISVQNSASIGRYDVREQTLNVNVHENRDDSTDRKIKRWENYSTYSSPQKSGMQDLGKGYWIKRADNINKGSLQNALNVAKRVAEVIILSSHRSIEVTLKSKKFAPQFSITQTHGIDFQHLKGKFKVARLQHTIDLVNKRASTEVTYKLFSNAENQTYTVSNMQSPRANLNLFKNPIYNGYLGVYTIYKGAKIFDDEEEYEEWQDEQGGMPSISTHQQFLYYKASGLIREETYTDRGVTFGQEREFQVIADEIEEESTETMDIEIKQVAEMNIPNDIQELIA